MRGGACSQTNENQMLPSLPGMPRSLQPQRESFSATASCWTLIDRCAAHQLTDITYSQSSDLWGFVTSLIVI